MVLAEATETNPWFINLFGKKVSSQTISPLVHFKELNYMHLIFEVSLRASRLPRRGFWVIWCRTVRTTGGGPMKVYRSVYRIGPRA